MNKILSPMRRAIQDYNMISAGDKIAVGVSGGKDSLTLLTALAAYRRFSEVPFEVIGITVDMGFEGDDTLVLTAASPDGTDGFPGNAELEVRYSLAGAGLMIQYTLTTDAPTVANITNHSYFNLNGHASGSVLGHRLSLDAPAYLETDAGSIPTGRKIAVAGTPMDFTEEKTIGRDINADYPALKQCGGYDHCYVIADSGLRHTAWLTGPETGIRMETLTTQPGVQLYTSNFLKSATACKDGASYGQYSAVCLETQDFPDAPNHPDFPDTTVLPDRPYSATTLYRFDLAPL